jgi:hypothetical protein
LHNIYERKALRRTRRIGLRLGKADRQ